ncbi:MAG: amidohydrolase family protein [Planctomycetaceae bacterium]|nr:amidohydrolase family protein [Planctomycetaceae bacterium]
MLIGPVAEVAAQPAEERCDVLLRGGTVHRGDGSPGVVADVAVRDGRIVAVGAALNMVADQQLDCSGLIVCPGFIDLHNHSDDVITERDTRANINYLMQGCTTVVTGNCGFGPVDTGKYLNAIDKDGAGTNVAHLLPQGSLRSQVMGDVNREARDEELAEMRQLAEQAMIDGAFGMSTGLIYVPGTFTQTPELIEIAKVVGKHQGIYASHIRNEGTELAQSVAEAIEIGAAAGAPVHISHFKASGKDAWGSLRVAVSLIEAAREKGQVVTADQYPYMASSTSLQATLIPTWAREGGRQALLERLQDPETLSRLQKAIAESIPRKGRIQIATFRKNPAYVGKSLEEIAALDGREVVDVVLQIERDGGASVVHFGMQEEEIRSVMPLPWLATASDGGAKVINDSMPHPRSFGTFARKIGRYAIEDDVLSLEAAIRSSSSLPAEILGLSDRGLVDVGKVADLSVFDPQTFRDRATFAEPFLQCAGTRHVLVNGQLAVHDGIPTGRLAGRAVRKTAAE